MCLRSTIMFRYPHGAVGYYALDQYLQQHKNDKGFFLETAHPVKFIDTVQEATNTQIDFPENLQYLLNRRKAKHKDECLF